TISASCTTRRGWSRTRSARSRARSSSTRRCRSPSATSRSPTTTRATTINAWPSCGSGCARPPTTASLAGSWGAPTRSWGNPRKRSRSSSSSSRRNRMTSPPSSSSGSPRKPAGAQTNLSLERYNAERKSQQQRARQAPEPQVVEGNALAHYNLGLAFRQKGYYNEALKEYRLALERGEDRRLTLQAMAEVHLLKRDLAAALELYDTLLHEVPDSPKLWN